MAKTIKFNLILDNYPVRDIAGLQEHFSIEDMLKYFKNGLLLRWLKVRGYGKQHDAVKAIEKSTDREIVISLVNIFRDVDGVKMDIADADIEKAIYILDYLDKEKKSNAEHKENAFAKKKVVDRYHEGYNELIKHLEENKENMALLKADAILMESEYFRLFELNYYELYFRLVESAPKAIFAILTRDAFRKFWIGDKANKKIYSSVESELLATNKAKEILGDDLKIVKRNTQAMWDQIERPEVKLMVISINKDGAFIKNAGNFSEKLGYDEVHDKLLKFDGLEYQCNNKYYELLYMEV